MVQKKSVLYYLTLKVAREKRLAIPTKMDSGSRMMFCDMLLPLPLSHLPEKKLRNALEAIASKGLPLNVEDAIENRHKMSFLQLCDQIYPQQP